MCARVCVCDKKLSACSRAATTNHRPRAAANARHRREQMKTYRTRKSGFTLVEILIVVIILGILAAIVIPQFTNASTDARNSSVASTLQTLRGQIELYKIQHADTPPALTSM